MIVLHACEVGEFGIVLARSCRLDLVGRTGASPSRPHCGLLPNRATTAGERWRGRDLYGSFREIVGTDTAAVLVGGVELRPLRPVSFNTRTKHGGILQHKIDIPIFEDAELLLLVYELLHGQTLHILLGHAAGCRTKVVFVDAGKSGERSPQPLPLFLALLSIVRLPNCRAEFDLVLANAPSHPVDSLVSPDGGILDYTHLGLCQGDALRLAPDGSPSLVGLLLISFVPLPPCR